MMAPMYDSGYRSSRARPTNVWAVVPVAGIGRVLEEPGGLVVGHHDPQRGLPELSGELAPHSRVDDRAGVDEREGRRDLKDLLPLQKERTLLRKKQRESLVGLDLGAIRTSICEKSGLNVTSAVRFGVRPYFTPSPISPSGSRWSNTPVSVSSVPNRTPVTSGRISRFRLWDSSVSPSSTPNWVSWPATPREIRRPGLRLRLPPDDTRDLEAPLVLLAGRPVRG